MIRGGAKGQKDRYVGRQKRYVREHRGVRKLGNALIHLGIVKMHISGKQIETMVRAAKLLSTHYEKQR